MEHQHEHYDEVLAWFVYYLLELGPKRVYRDFDEVLSLEVSNRINEGDLSDKDLLRFIEESEDHRRQCMSELPEEWTRQVW